MRPPRQRPWVGGVEPILHHPVGSIGAKPTRDGYFDQEESGDRGGFPDHAGPRAPDVGLHPFHEAGSQSELRNRRCVGAFRLDPRNKKSGALDRSEDSPTAVGRKRRGRLGFHVQQPDQKAR
jgi:hypothetical protein